MREILAKSENAVMYRGGETCKARERRLKEGWFDKYALEHLSGVDIGCGGDALRHTFRRYDLGFGDSDATYMEGVPDEIFHTVYASHILEHLAKPIVALQNWFRILKKTGHLIVCVPHRDLYEKQLTLPSRWNKDHKTFWLPDKCELPCTLSLRDTILHALPNGQLISLRVIDEGYVDNGPDKHAGGEYSIEAIVKK